MTVRLFIYGLVSILLEALGCRAENAEKSNPALATPIILQVYVADGEPVIELNDKVTTKEKLAQWMLATHQKFGGEHPVLIHDSHEVPPGEISDLRAIVRKTHADVRVTSEQVLSEEDVKKFTPISKAITAASKLRLYKGASRPDFVSPLPGNGLVTRKTIRLHGFPFYEYSLEVPDEIIERLRQLMAAPESYRSLNGPKLWAPSHPDYCLAWGNGAAEYHLLIWFGSKEMKLYGPDSELNVNIQVDACRELESLLKRFSIQSPATVP